MLLRELVTTSAAVAAESGRRGKTASLAALLGRLAPDEIAVAIAFLSGDTRQGRLGVGPAAIWEARATPPVETPALELLEVDQVFERLARLSGPGSADERVRLLRSLLGRATAAEQDFLQRLLFGELRQGALEGVLLEAVALAGGVPAAALRRAGMMAGGLAAAAPAVLTGGESAIARFAVQVFHPVQPMLAQPAADLNEALARVGDEAAVECKLDGARIQVHKAGDDVRVFSRTLREVTAATPEVVEAVRALPVRDAIFDGEVIALRPDGAPHQFQTTMQRFGRKLDVDRLRSDLPLTPFFFDCVLVDGRPLVDEPYEQRLAALAAAAPPFVVPSVLRPTPREAASFLDEMLSRGHEGVMVKALGSRYAAGRRGRQWQKVKAASTLDLVVLAAEWGHGRRKGWLSNLHLGARDPSEGAFVMLGKTFKGLTDEMLAWQTETLLPLAIARTDHVVHVRPQLVVEIAFNGVQASPHYPGGLALRFARVKAYRPDKPAADADTIDTVREIHRRLNPPVP